MQMGSSPREFQVNWGTEIDLVLGQLGRLETIMKSETTDPGADGSTHGLDYTGKR
jgi:hypothetical protein